MQCVTFLVPFFPACWKDVKTERSSVSVGGSKDGQTADWGHRGQGENAPGKEVTPGGGSASLNKVVFLFLSWPQIICHLWNWLSNVEEGDLN